MNPEAQYVNEPWVLGITASGITGPTVDATHGATVSEQCDHNQYMEEFDAWVAEGMYPEKMPVKKIEHPSILITQGMRVVAIVPTSVGDGEKNARLIVAAPKLLKALKELVKLFGPYGDYTNNAVNVMDQVSVVIKEAEGL